MAIRADYRQLLESYLSTICGRVSQGLQVVHMRKAFAQCAISSFEVETALRHFAFQNTVVLDQGCLNLLLPNAGFTKLPKQVDDAATQSKTIRYQRDLIRRYANNERLNLVPEEVFLETEPDRGSETIAGPLTKVAKICSSKAAILLLVDFSVQHGWRGHTHMTNCA